MGSLSSTFSRVPLWRDVRVLRWAFQLLVLAGVFAFIYWLYNNYQVNISKSQIQTDLTFLDNPASFTIPGNDFDQSQPVRDALVQGFLNTLRVAFVGILLATLLGTLVGIARLSGNFLLRAVATAYVEVVRNLPLLLLLTFMNLAVVLQTFPRIEDAWLPLDLFVISNRGLALPWFEGSGYILLGVIVVALLAMWVTVKIRNSQADKNGKPAYGLRIGALIAVVIIASGWLLLGFNWTLPFVEGRGTVGGLRLDPSFFALLVALVVYTSSHIAEIVRGSILAVPKGQGEAADAIALSAGQKMRLIILPQAFRVAMPALGNQYLNLIKNSSLGATISYFELTQVAQITVGNGSPAVPAFTLTLLVYLAISLVTSLVVNYFNRKLALVER
jgi:general L-amino acid transport system permease protein